jgi:hypothetical protein
VRGRKTSKNRREKYHSQIIKTLITYLLRESWDSKSHRVHGERRRKRMT